MSDEVKDKTFEFPMMPIFGVDLGRELGSLDSRLSRVENDIQKLDAKIDAVDSRVDKCAGVITRMDERVKSLGGDIKSIRTMVIGLYGAVAAGVILQIFFKF